MANANYTALIEQLEKISNEPSDNGNHRGYSEARKIITDSKLSETEKSEIISVLAKSASPNGGYYYNSNGVHGALKAIAELEAANDDSFDPEPPTTLTVSELISKVENGRIFGVSFTKRTTGGLRVMSCRLGVKKFLRGGKMSYSPADKQLLTVFSMKDKGYRMIPLDAIQRLSVGGKQYTIAGV